MRFRSMAVVLGIMLVLAIGFVGAQGPQESYGASSPFSFNQRDAKEATLFLGSEIARIVRGYEVAPVRLDLRKKDYALVGLGSYLVNVAGACGDCHTTPTFAPGGDPFRGQPKRVNGVNHLAGGVAFGPFVSRNLTPDPQTGRPANLTFEQFRQTMRTGVDLKNAHPQISPLLQVMPWPVYQEMTDRDLRAIYEYLRAIPHAEPGTGS
jgi:mono/diheme cytochrome c family protein